MSSEIYYDKAFVSVGNRFIPLVCRGSTNTYEFNAHGREIAERYWSVLNLPYRGRLLFTSDEIQKIAETHEGFSSGNRGGMRKSRNSAFEAGEFQRWFLAGLKNAHTIEEYRQYGNSIVLTDQHTQKITYAPTTEAFLAALSRIGEQNADIRFDSCRSFYHPPHVSKQSKFDKLKQFYIRQLQPCGNSGRKGPRRSTWRKMLLSFPVFLFLLSAFSQKRQRKRHEHIF